MRRDITGPGITTEVGMDAADLGIARWDPDRQQVAVMFGDNFTSDRQQGQWQSPSIVMYDRDFKVAGIPVPGGTAANEPRRQLWPYEHNNPVFSTVLPTDFIRVGDWWYVHVMVEQGLGNEVWTEWQRSRDLVTWEWVRKVQPPISNMITLSFDQFGGWVYVAGTGGLHRIKPIYGWRVRSEEFPNGPWLPLGTGLPLIKGSYGELCLRNVGGVAVLGYFDAARARMSCRVLERPDGDWAVAPEYVYATAAKWGAEGPTAIAQPYGGYIWPTSVLNEQDGMVFLVSQWNTTPGANDTPYKVIAVSATVPMTPAEPEDPMADPTLTEIVKDLSADGQPPIINPEGNKLTLRAAIKEAWEKLRNIYTLVGRPRDPRQGDDIYGHVMSLRAEHLITQRIVVELAKRSGLSAAELGALRQEVVRSLK